MENPFAHLIPQQQGQPSAPSADAPYTVGIPRQPTISPAEQRRLELSERADARAAQANDRAAAAAERTAATAATPTESERTAAFLATRVAGGARNLQTVLRETPSAASPELDAAFFGSIFGQTARNYFNTEQRQRVEAAQLDILDAALTLGTGAAYTREQLEGYRQSYFPQIADSPGTIRDKEVRLRQLMASARVKAGRSAPSIDEALASLGVEAGEGRDATEQTAREAAATVYGGDQPPAALSPAGTQPPASPETVDRTAAPPSVESAGGQNVAGEGGAYLTEQDRELTARAQAMFNRGATRAELDAFMARNGRQPFGADLDDAIRTRQRGGAVSIQATPTGQSEARFGAGLSEVADSPVGATVAGVADTATLGSIDEVSSALSALEDVRRGGDFTESYNSSVTAFRGNRDAIRDNNPLSYLGGQVAGGFALPTGGADSIRRLITLGAEYGGAYGLNSADTGDVGDRLVAGAEGAVIGAGAAGVLGAGARGISRLGSGSRSGRRAVATDLVAAANRQSVDLMPADVAGPMIGRLTGGAAQLPFASGPVIRGAQRVNTQTGARLADVASAEGVPLRQEQFGEAARNAAEGYIERSGAEGRRLYDSARSGAEGATATVERAVGALDEHIAELASTPNTSAPEIGALQRLRGDLVGEGGPVSLDIDSLRRLRTNVRAMAQEEGLRGSDFQRRAGLVLSSLSEDVAQSLPADAAAAFRSADRHWAERLNVIDDVMSNVLGPRDNRSAEGVAQRLVSMSRGDSARLRTFINNVTPEESGVVRASLIQELGRASSGQQGAEGANFSLSSFLTNWDRLPERSRNLLFRGESRAAINDLATIAEGARESAKYANTSNTAGATSTRDLVRVGSLYSAWGTMGATALLENLTGRLLASPRFARWLGRPPQDRGRALRRLAQIAAREPELAPDILPIQRALETAAPRAAAEQEDDGR